MPKITAIEELHSFIWHCWKIAVDCREIANSAYEDLAREWTTQVVFAEFKELLCMCKHLLQNVSFRAAVLLYFVHYCPSSVT